MKQLMFLLVLAITGVKGFCQSANDVTGVWFDEKKEGKIQIYAHQGKYEGKLIWMENPYEADGKTLKKDVKNKDAALRSRSLLNMVILSGFSFSNGKWVSGKIYDPRSGKTYSAEMKLDGNNKLDLRGYIGNPLFGRTAVFTRSK